MDYVVKDGQVIIVDEFTGRLMPGRRWSDGLHQAVEAKEGRQDRAENQTLATITFQNYFRMYEKLAGMTGTADTEAEEFAKIYKLDVTVIPTNRPLIRVNHPDVVYKTEREKFDAVVEEIEELPRARASRCWWAPCRSRSPSSSPSSSSGTGVQHQVLNAKYHEREAEIVAQAGREGAVTIATNMAGRGTDILLGGNPDFLAKEILRKRGIDPATASPEAQRVGAARKPSGPPTPSTSAWSSSAGCTSSAPSATSRGASTTSSAAAPGRQGDPGSSRFYLSLEDDLLRIFGSERIQRIMDRLGMEEGEPIEHGSSRAPSSTPRSASRRATSRSASTCSSTTT